MQITDSGVVVSLPGGLTGQVPANEISDVLHKVYGNAASMTGKRAREYLEENVPEISSIISMHQPVRVYVLEAVMGSKKEGKKKSLTLSMRSSLVNRGIALKHLMPGFPISGCVTSKEDHGFIVSAGVSGVTFFLPFSGVPQNLGELVIGKPVDCIVDSVNEGARTATLRAQRKSVAEAITRGSLLPFNALGPGMLFHVIVEKVVRVSCAKRTDVYVRCVHERDFSVI
jgi:rRNA biogenesis protein RRP5